MGLVKYQVPSPQMVKQLVFCRLDYDHYLKKKKNG